MNFHCLLPLMPLLALAGPRAVRDGAAASATASGRVSRITRNANLNGIRHLRTAMQTHDRVREATSSKRALPVYSSAPMAAKEGLKEIEEVKRVIRREYESFFAPMERSFYAPDVEFIDPLTSFRGVDNYKNNVDMLGGRSFFGQFAFSDAKIQLHDITQPSRRNLRTRWTLSFKFKLVPWQPTAIFTGVSDYTLDSNFKIKRQEDYWDSVNLEEKGHYVKKPALNGLMDFVAQLNSKPKEYATPELPYVLLRRAPGYQVRAYPGYEAVEIPYEKRSDAWGILGMYANGGNSEGKRLTPYVPSIMQIEATDDGKWRKYMQWAMRVIDEGEKARDVTIPNIGDSNGEVLTRRPTVYAVKTFSEPLTEDTVTFFHDELLEDLKRDGLVPEFEETKTYVQYDQLYSLGKRRNEIWIPLDGHPWPY